MAIFTDGRGAHPVAPGHLTHEAKTFIGGAALGLVLGAGATILAPANLDSETDDVFTAPHPTPSPQDSGLLATLDWTSSPDETLSLSSWDPGAEAGWPGVALAAGDLWALETVTDWERTILYLLSPRGNRVALMALPGDATVVGWDHDAGLAYADGPDGPMVIDLASHRWADIPFDPNWGADSEEELYASPLGVTTGGDVVWNVWGDVDALGTWNPGAGWDVASLSFAGSCHGSFGPSDWVLCRVFDQDRVLFVNAVTHEEVSRPESWTEWLTVSSPSFALWLDADTIAKPPLADEGWLSFDGPDFDTGRPMGPEDLPISTREEYSRLQYPGTPLVATLDDTNVERIDRLGLLTAEGYVEILDLPDGEGIALRTNEPPVEVRPGVFLFTYWNDYRGPLLVVDVNTGEVFDYGILSWPPAYPDDGGELDSSHVVYIAPTEG